jgi:hypothetical protein
MQARCILIVICLIVPLTALYLLARFVDGKQSQRWQTIDPPIKRKS